MNQKKIRIICYGFIISMFIGLFIGMCSQFRLYSTKDYSNKIDDKCPHNLINKPDCLTGKLFDFPIDTITTK